MLRKQVSSSSKAMWLFFAFYFLLWGVLPSMVLKSIYMDSAENLALSHALSWSYSKHPPLGMFVLRIFNAVFNNECATYLAAATCLAASLYFIYKISLRYLDAKTAVAATVLSSLSYYFLANFVFQYNQNTIMLPFWLASIYYFLQAIDTNKIKHWLILGIVCFLGVMAKYETLIIIGLEFIYLLLIFQKRFCKGVIVAAVVFFVLLAPHIYWLFQHPFNPIHFALNKSLNHVNSQLYVFYKALIVQPMNLLLAVFVLLTTIVIKHAGKAQRSDESKNLNPLVFFAIGPWLVFCIFSLFANTRSEWGYPILALWIPAIVYQFNIKYYKLRGVVIISCVLQVLIFCVYLLANAADTKMHRINYPGYAIASAAQNFWVQHNMPAAQINFVGGQEYAVFYLAAYLPSKPLMLKNNSFASSPWINKSDFLKQGAVFIDYNCDNATDAYSRAGFSVLDRRCFTVDLANKFKPSRFSFTLYLIGPKRQYTTN